MSINKSYFTTMDSVSFFLSKPAVSFIIIRSHRNCIFGAGYFQVQCILYITSFKHWICTPFIPIDRFNYFKRNLSGIFKNRIEFSLEFRFNWVRNIDIQPINKTCIFSLSLSFECSKMTLNWIHFKSVMFNFIQK